MSPGEYWTNVYMGRLRPEVQPLSQTQMTDFPTLWYTSTSKIHTLSYTWSLKKVLLSSGAFPYRPSYGLPTPRMWFQLRSQFFSQSELSENVNNTFCSNYSTSSCQEEVFKFNFVSKGGMWVSSCFSQKEKKGKGFKKNTGNILRNYYYYYYYYYLFSGYY